MARASGCGCALRLLGGAGDPTTRQACVGLSRGVAKTKGVPEARLMRMRLSRYVVSSRIRGGPAGSRAAAPATRPRSRRRPP